MTHTAGSPITPHPESARLAAALQQGLALAIAWQGGAFRFTDMTYANLRDLATGEGSRKAGGRWNPKGALAALYLSATPETALAEALAHHRSQLIPDVEASPLTLAGFRVRVQRLLNLTDRHIRRLLGVSAGQLRQPWRPLQHTGQEALTQAIGRLAHEHGLQGLLVSSAVQRRGRNLVLFPDYLGAGDLIVVHDHKFPLVRRRLRHQ
jgi:RES domain-containing protein